MQATCKSACPFFGDVIKVDYDPGAGSLTLHSRNGDKMTKFLSNALLALREKQGHARAQALLNYLNMTEAMEGVDELGKVLPVLKSRNFVDVARQQMMQAVKDEPDPPQFVYLDEAEDLVRLFVVNGDTAVSYVMTTALDGWGIDVGELAETAQANLYKFLSKTGVQIAKRSQFQYVEIDGQFESSVAFLPKFWAQVQDQSGGAAPIAAFLSRDKVFFTHENDAQGTAAPRTDQRRSQRRALRDLTGSVSLGERQVVAVQARWRGVCSSVRPCLSLAH